MNSFTDEQLMELFQNNKDGQGAIAFDFLYNRYAKRMVNFFYYSLHNDYKKAQDFLHDLFLKIIENKARFDRNQQFQAWIYRIAYNMCKNEFRSLALKKKYQDYAIPGKEISNNEPHMEDDLQVFINSMEQEQRSLIILRFKFNLSVREIANICECPEGTVKSRLFYATRELSRLYKLENHGNQKH
jgi:RNA polymerase sigma-70 factor (ECF subfamily)